LKFEIDIVKSVEDSLLRRHSDIQVERAKYEALLYLINRLLLRLSLLKNLYFFLMKLETTIQIKIDESGDRYVMITFVQAYSKLKKFSVELIIYKFINQVENARCFLLLS
jgi:hypothetical protein